MDKRILKALLLCVLLDAGPLVSGGWFCNNPSPPICADDCDGNGYYLNEDETECIQCPECPPGLELNKACGNGLNGDAVCIPCPEGFFSSSTSKQCTPCTTCINTVERESCQLTQDRVCGDCLPGFVRSSGRFSTDQNACPDRCSDLPRDDLRCGDWWKFQQEPNAPNEQPAEPPLDPDLCEPEPPRCIDHCHDGNYYLDYDGMCKICLQCQPGEELNKVCGRGKNGDAKCQRCPEGTFSVDGLGRCTPCRICVNTVATECTSTRDSECGECLPGYYQEANGFFPDQEACPNKCMACPTSIPQCQEWCESKEDAGEVTTVAAKFISQKADVLKTDSDKEEINKEEAGSPSANHASYMMIFTVLVSLLAAVFVILVIILIVFRHVWKKTSGSNASVTAGSMLLRDSSSPSSPECSPISTRQIYNPTVHPIPPVKNSLDFITFSRNAAFQNVASSIPFSGSSTDGENESSAASTPRLNAGRRMRENHSTQSGQSDQGSRVNAQLGYSEDSSPCSSSPNKVVTEKDFVTVHAHAEDQMEANGRLIRRRRSITKNDELLSLLLNDQRYQGHRRNSLPNLPLGSLCNGNKKSRKGNNENIPRVKKEPEAALCPNDSTDDDGSITSVSAEPKYVDQSLKPTAPPYTASADTTDIKPRGPYGTLPVLQETSPTTTTQKKPFPKDAGNIGNKSPGETNVTIHINMTAKDVENFHVGDVHNRHNYAHQTDLASEQHYEDGDQDDDEAEKLLNINTTETDAIPAGDGRSKLTSGDDSDDVRNDICEEDKLLDPKS